MTPLERYARRIVRMPRSILARVLVPLLGLRFIAETRETQTPITFDMWFRQQVLGRNHGPYWPVHPTSTVIGWRNILAGVETSPGYMEGCYIQALGTITIGDYTQIGPKVALISANHAKHDLRQHDIQSIQIGRYCWLGFGSVILPGTTLGDFTIVAANAVVTKSFPGGYCVIAGNPAREIRKLDPGPCVEHKSLHEYHGFIAKSQFEAFRAAHLHV